VDIAKARNSRSWHRTKRRYRFDFIRVYVYKCASFLIFKDVFVLLCVLLNDEITILIKAEGKLVPSSKVPHNSFSKPDIVEQVDGLYRFFYANQPCLATQ